jgi:hypothetical protein
VRKHLPGWPLHAMNPSPTSSPAEQQDGHCRCGLRVRRLPNLLGKYTHIHIYRAHCLQRLEEHRRKETHLMIPPLVLLYLAHLWAFWGVWLTVLLWGVVSWLRQHLSPKAVRASSIGSVDGNDDDHRGRRQERGGATPGSADGDSGQSGRLCALALTPTPAERSQDNHNRDV